MSEITHQVLIIVEECSDGECDEVVDYTATAAEGLTESMAAHIKDRLVSLLEVDDTARGEQQRFGYWGEHPDHPIEDWKYEITNDDTRLGYWGWVVERLKEEE